MPPAPASTASTWSTSTGCPGTSTAARIDVTRCGGITGLLRAAAVAAAAGLEISAHCPPHQHLPVAAATPNRWHIEWFYDHVRIEPMLFDGAASATGGSAPMALNRLGHGLKLRAAQAETYRVH